MIHLKQVIEISKTEADAMQKILDLQYSGPECDRDGLFATYSAEFGDGWEADIKVCNGDGPYIDAILFHDGHQAQVLDISEKLVGEFRFVVEGTEYIVEIKVV